MLLTLSTRGYYFTQMLRRFRTNEWREKIFRTQQTKCHRYEIARFYLSFFLAIFFGTFLSLAYYRMSVKYVYFAAAGVCPFGLFHCSLIHKYTSNVNEGRFTTFIRMYTHFYNVRKQQPIKVKRIFFFLSNKTKMYYILNFYLMSTPTIFFDV